MPREPWANQNAPFVKTPSQPKETGETPPSGQAMPHAASECRAPAEYFATTHWSVVLTAQRSDSTRAHVALSSLCQAYWYPLYAFVRRQGHGPHDAQDLTQEFFARLLEKN